VVGGTSSTCSSAKHDARIHTLTLRAQRKEKEREGNGFGTHPAELRETLANESDVVGGNRNRRARRVVPRDLNRLSVGVHLAVVMARWWWWWW
jgi:hypothetical protein